MASRALDLMITRVTDPVRKTFGKFLFEHGTIVAGIAQSRMEIEQARLLVLSAALQIDLVRAKGAMKDIGMSKVKITLFLRSSAFANHYPSHSFRLSYQRWSEKSLIELCKFTELKVFVVSRIIIFCQRAESILNFRYVTTEDTPLAALWAGMRTLRFADGPDEVHIAQIGAQELKRAPALWTAKRTMEANEEKIRKAAGLKASHL